MLSSGWTWLLIAAVVVVGVMAFEYEKKHPVAGLYPQDGKRIYPKSNADFLYTGTDAPAACIDRVNAYHKAGTALGGFDVGGPADPGCHIYKGSLGGNYTLQDERAYTAYLPRASGARVMAP